MPTPFKQIYQDKWKAGMKRQNVVIGWLTKKVPDVAVETVGFGANSVGRVEGYGSEPGLPDLLLRDVLSGAELCRVEVTGTDRRHEELWVGAHKLAYADRHPEQDVWIAMVFGAGTRPPIFIKPSNGRVKEAVVMNLKGKDERYVVLGPDDPDVYSPDDFLEWLRDEQAEARDLGGHYL